MGRYFKLLFLLIPFSSFAQKAEMNGRVSASFGNETLPGVNILLDSVGVATTGPDGMYHFFAEPGKHVVSFSFIGYIGQSIPVDLKPGENLSLNIRLKPLIVELSTAVVSAAKYEQRLSDITVSMEVMKPDFIQQQNTYQLDDALRLLPGVDVMDGQANIRGGSGYAYGAGSRVMLLVDDLPMLTGDVNDVKWNYIPVELIGQVEVIKGASSALYGSSALNGVINVRTATPGSTPQTTVNVSGGFYTQPARKDLSWWWDRLPLYGGLQVSHLRKAGPFDISLGLNGFAEDGYRTENYQRYGRFTAGLRYSPPKLKGFSAGMHTSFQLQESSDFLLWTDADSGAFVQNPVSVTPLEGWRVNVDPFVSYFDKRKGAHHLKTRYYSLNNSFPDDPDKDNGSDYYYGEYQYQKEFTGELHWTIGMATSYTAGNSALYGDHTGSTLALFTQLDKRFFDRLSASLGFRWEQFSLDNNDTESKPVVRAGLNYQLAQATYLRASFGQGYRYPSMAEKYTATSLGSLHIFPNPDLMSETGWSAEIGLRQGYHIGNWSGYVDLAGFWTEYQDMMEFVFGLYLPDSNTIPTLDHIGFKSINIGAARINGIDVSATGSGSIRDVTINFFVGYTYMNPLDMSSDSADQILKYRYRHSFKSDVGVGFRQFEAGITMTYQSFIERIDEAFEEVILGQEFFPGLKDYRLENNKGAFVLDFRIGWQLSKSSEIRFIMKNLLNQEYMGRPGDIQPPRSISLQYVLKIK